MTWDVKGKGDKAVRMGMGPGGSMMFPGKDREVSAVDWGMDMVSLL
jgi:hypothetical protein